MTWVHAVWIGCGGVVIGCLLTLLGLWLLTGLAPVRDRPHGDYDGDYGCANCQRLVSRIEGLLLLTVRQQAELERYETSDAVHEVAIREGLIAPGKGR
jgi:hypothetical protein